MTRFTGNHPFFTPINHQICELMFYNGKVISVDPPQFVDLEVSPLSKRIYCAECAILPCNIYLDLSLACKLIALSYLRHPTSLATSGLRSLRPLPESRATLPLELGQKAQPSKPEPLSKCRHSSRYNTSAGIYISIEGCLLNFCMTWHPRTRK